MYSYHLIRTNISHSDCWDISDMIRKVDKNTNTNKQVVWSEWGNPPMVSHAGLPVAD